MKNTKLIVGFVGLFLAGVMVVSTTSFADTTQYKQSFSAHLTAAGEATSTVSTMTGDAQFNVAMDETSIDYQVQTSSNDGITSIVIECTVNGNEIHQVATLNNGTGTLVMSNLTDDAVKCTPNIHTIAHLVQAMREGSICVNVLTVSNPTGEIRGCVTNGTATFGSTTIATSTPVTTGTSTSTSTPTTSDNGNSGSNTGGSNNGGVIATSSVPTLPTSGSTDNGDATSTATITATTTATTTISDNSDSTAGTSSVASYTSNYVGTGATFIPTNIFQPIATSSCVYLTSYIIPGAKNDPYQVTLLQLFLNKNMNAGLTLNGTYDAKTISSVNAFQLNHSEDVLKPWVVFGLPTSTTTTSRVYKTTKWKINSIMCGTPIAFPELP